MFTVVAKFTLLRIDVFSVQLAVHELYNGLLPHSQQIICSTTVNASIFGEYRQKPSLRSASLQRFIEP